MMMRGSSSDGNAARAGDSKGHAGRIGDHPVVKAGARVGFVVNGLLHLMIGFFGILLASGNRSGSADQGGALSALASTGMGRVALVVFVAGFALLALWQFTEAVTVGEAKDKLKAVGKGVLYAALAGLSLRVMLGATGSSARQTQDVTAALMSAPFGQVLVGVLGAVVAGAGVAHVWIGWKRSFLKDLTEHPGAWAEISGRIGYIAKGIALIGVGALFVIAAVRHRAKEAKGLDGALRSLLELPFGSALVIGLGLGFAAFAVFSMAKARYADL